jgi:hypothetical protein
MPQSAIVFFSHRFDAEVRARYDELRRSCAGRDAICFILAQVGTSVPEDLLAETHFFDFSAAAACSPRLFGDSLVPGNLHIPCLDFHAAHPGFRFYWFIEYDVVFSGDWRDFFDAFSDDTSDLVAAHVRTHAEEPHWCWWSSLALPEPNGQRGDWLRAFLPIHRLSRAGFEALADRVRAGWSGHFEGLIPTALASASLRISDIGGDGPFVPEERKNRFYTSFSCCDGSLLGFGTFRFRPVHRSPRAATRLLYHPVKHGATRRWDRPAFGYLVHAAKHRPLGLLRHVWTTIGILLSGRFRAARRASLGSSGPASQGAD